MKKIKCLLGFIFVICFCNVVSADPPGTRKTIILKISPGSNNQSVPYVTVGVEHTNIAKASLAWAGSSNNVDIFHITIELKEYGETTARIVINRSGYILEVLLVRITVADGTPSISPNDEFIEKTLIPISRTRVFNFEYNFFNLLNKDVKSIQVPYRE